VNQDELKRILDYSPETGEFRWKVNFSRVRIGDIAGYVDKHGHGYRMVSINSQMYLEHRLAFLWMTGKWPDEEVDHINRIRDDNRWSNLRPASRLVNSLNMGVRKDNTSGVTGVSWRKDKKRWEARIYMNGVVHRLGRFQDFEEAVEARRVALSQFESEVAA